MPSQRSFDIDEVLSSAARIFCRHGYEGASISTFTQELQLSAPSLYAAFGSKQGLFEAVLERCAKVQQMLMDKVLAAPSAYEVAEQFLYGQAKLMKKEGGLALRFLTVAAPVVGPGNGAILEAAAGQRRAMEQALVGRMDLARSKGDLPLDASPKGLAALLFAVLQGLALRDDELSSVELDEILSSALRAWPRRSAGLSAPIPSKPREMRGRKKAFSPPDTLTLAMHVFWRKGYEGTSITDLTTAMGISRPSLYATFGNKEALFLSALKRYRDDNMAYGREALQAPTAREVAQRMLDGAVASQISEIQPRGCFWMINSMQGGDDAKTIRSAVLQCMSEAQSLLAARLKRARVEGDLPTASDPDAVARLLGSLLHEIAILGTAGASARQLQKFARNALAAWPFEPTSTKFA